MVNIRQAGQHHGMARLNARSDTAKVKPARAPPLQAFVIDSFLDEISDTVKRERNFWTEYVAAESKESNLSRVRTFLRSSAVILARSLTTLFSTRGSENGWLGSFFSIRRDSAGPPSRMPRPFNRLYDEFHAHDGRVFVLNPYRINDYIDTCSPPPRGSSVSQGGQQVQVCREAAELGRPCGSSCAPSSSTTSLDGSAKFDTRFWECYLTGMTGFIVYIHKVNISMLIAVLIFFFLFPFSDGRAAYYDLISDVVVWLFISMVSALALVEAKGGLRLRTSGSKLKTWRSVGLLALGIRLTSLCRDIIKSFIASYYFGAEQTYSFCTLPERLVRGGDPAPILETIILRIVLEVSQMAMFSMVPFPSMLIFWMCVVEMILQFRRLTGCTDFVVASVSVAYRSLASEYILNLILTLLCFYGFVMLSSYSILNSSRSTYLSMEKARASGEKIKNLINFLCKEIRLPLQLMSRITVNSADTHSTDTTTKFIAITNGINQDLERIRLVSSNLLILTKMEENFAFFSASQLIDIRRLFESALSRQSTNFGDISQYLVVSFAHTEICGNHSVLSAIMNNLAYLALFYVECTRIKIGEEALQPRYIYVTFFIEEIVEEKRNCSDLMHMLRISLVSNHAAATSHMSASSESNLDEKKAEVNTADSGFESVSQTVLMACKTITESFGGGFTMLATEAKFSLRVSVDSRDKGLIQPDNGLSTLNVAILARNHHSISPIESAVEMLGFHLIRTVISEGNLDQDSTTAVMEELLSCEIIFVSDPQCSTDSILNKRIVYFDSDTRECGDQSYHLDLPLSSKSIEEFQSWCRSRHIRKDSDSTFLSDQSFNFIKKGFGGMPLFSDAVEESFLKWRIFSPTKSLFHRSMCVDAAVYTILGYSIFLTTNGGSFFYLSYYIGLTLFAGVLSIRYRLYMFLEQYRFTAHQMWISLMALMIITYFLAVFLLFVNVIVLKERVESALTGHSSTEGSIFQVWQFSDIEQVRNMSTTNMKSTPIFGSASFAKSLQMPLGCTQLVVIWALHLVWPMGYIFIFLMALRSVCIQLYVFPFFMDMQFIWTLSALLLVFFGLSALTLYHFELSTRVEFQSLRKTSFSTKYMELIQSLCQRDLMFTLDKVSRSRADHSKTLFDSGFVSDDELLNLLKNTKHVEMFHLGHSMIDALKFMLREQIDKDSTTTAIDRSNSAKVMIADEAIHQESYLCTVLLEVELKECCRLAQLYADALNIRTDMSLCVSAAVGVIKLNINEFKSLVLLCLQLAVKNLVVMQERGRGVARVHEISVRAEQLKSLGGEPQRFFDKRTLLIIIEDTGLVDDTSRSSHIGLDRVTFRHLPSGIFSCRHEISFSYRASTIEQSVAEYLNAEEAIYLVLKQKDVLCKFYERWYQLCFKQNRVLDANYETSIARKLSILYVKSSRSEGSNLKELFKMLGWSITTVTDVAMAIYRPSLLCVDCVLIDHYVDLRLEDAYGQLRSGDAVDNITALRLLGYESTVIALVDDVSAAPGLRGFHGVVGRPVVKSTLVEIDLICVKSKVAALIGANSNSYSV